MKTDAAKYLGLETSMMKRLMDLQLYQRDNANFHEEFIIQLLRNYRSPEMLLAVPNRKFYENKLIAMVKAKSDVLQYFGGKPLVFHSVVGGPHSRRDKRVPSLQNNAEVKVVMKYVIDLVKKHVAKNDIGVITPYKAQARLIQDRLIERGLASKPRLGQAGKPSDGIMVGSVDAFQGNERRIIVLSTVRSSMSGWSLGFLDNYQRFNVAVTRARELLIVIGDPRLLNKDDNWRALISHAKDHGVYKRY